MNLHHFFFGRGGGTPVRPGMQVVTPLKLKLCHVTMVFIHWYECLFSVG